MSALFRFALLGGRCIALRGSHLKGTVNFVKKIAGDSTYFGIHVNDNIRGGLKRFL